MKTKQQDFPIRSPRLAEHGEPRFLQIAEALQAAVAEGSLKPTLQNPTAVTIPERRRKELASIAKRCNVPIIEDDPYWLLGDVRPPPVAKFAPEQVHYISTLSKCLTPGLRVA